MSDLQNERQIPVFTVWKNNSILKNIFLINTPPNLSSHDDQEIVGGDQDFEETLLVGRHPDCDIRVEHPSISRFHLRIHSLPSTKSLFLTDLFSVHGTWVSDRRIEPNVRTIVKEGDSLRVGGSSRIYKLHWIPLSQAYDVSKSFVPPMDFLEQQEDEDEAIKEEISVGLKYEESHNVDNVSEDCQMVEENVLPQSPLLQPQKKLVSVENEATEFAGAGFEGLESVSLDEISIEVDHQKDMLITPSIRYENCEDDDDDDDVESSDSILNGLGPLLLSDISQELEHVPQLHSEDMGDVESEDSVLEGLVPLFMGENWEWVGLNENYLERLTEDRPQSSEDDYPALEELTVPFLDESSQLLSQNDIRLTPLKPDDMEVRTLEKVEGSDASFFDENSQSVLPKPLTEENVDDSTAEVRPELLPEIVGECYTEELTNQESVVSNSSSLNSSASPKPEYIEFPTENNLDNITAEIVGEVLQGSTWSFWVAGNLQTTECHTEKVSKQAFSVSNSSDLNSSSVVENQETQLWSFWSGKMGVESVCSALSDTESEAGNKSLANGYLSSSLNSIKSQKSTRSCFWSGRGKLESIGFSLSDADECLSSSENESSGDGYQSPKSVSSVKGRLVSPLMASDQNPIDSIWSRRVKDSTPRVLTSETEEKKAKDNQEEEVFTPDKENFTPTKHKSTRKFSVLKERNGLSSGRSPVPKMNFSPLSGKENYSAKTQRKQKTATLLSTNRVESLKLKERKGSRMPFQSLLANSPQKNLSESPVAEAETKTGCRRVNGVESKEPGQWNMVVDTTTLLNKESRKALQLLEGLKGTRLIIPRIVISELASLKRQVSFFRRNTEVLSALEWIQECMLRTGWWIHVQNSMDEGRPVAPTPPASPHQSQICAFSCFESQRDLLSPTVGDDVLDYALGYRNNRDGQLVLLSNDVTMKIKAMAEGMICETGEEFRESLVNPFSERFMWTESSPRGQTWCCADDFVLKQKFYPNSLKMTLKSMENVKGLKLILLRNSRP